MSTYNPSANSPIKVQQSTNCPACGQPIQEPVVPMNNAMNLYINDATGHQAVYNHGDPFIVVAGVKLRRSDVIEALINPQVEGAVTPLASGKQTQTPVKGGKPQAAPGVPASQRVPVVADIPVTNMNQVGLTPSQGTGQAINKQINPTLVNQPQPRVVANQPRPATIIPSAQLAKQPTKVVVGVTEGAPEPV